jgi:hypothetical protein
VRRALLLTTLAFAAALPGCVIVQTGVTNPIPGMTTVAVAPFVNLSAERVVDGRRFALAYHAELQKVPGFQVIPVGVTEQAMVDLNLDLNSPDDALQLAKALGADAIVIGAVTDYTPYYPPRIGLQVSWYAPKPQHFSPGIPIDPHLGEAVRVWRFAALPTKSDGSRDDDLIVRAQSPDSPTASTIACDATADASKGPVLLAPNAPPAPQVRMVAGQTGAAPMEAAVPSASSEPPVPPPPVASEQSPPEVSGGTSGAKSPLFPPANCPPTAADSSAVACPPPNGINYGDFTAMSAVAGTYDPRQPIMSYTRLFDGSDAELTALLRDYVILSGDLRSGGWEAYLHRTEDFIRFTSHRMIVEMLTLHGGESRRRYVWMLRKGHH